LQPNILNGYPLFIRDLYSMKFYTIDQVKPRFSISCRTMTTQPMDIKINICTSPFIPYTIPIRPKEKYIFCGKYNGENVQYGMKVFTIVINPTLYMNKTEHSKVNSPFLFHLTLFMFTLIW